MFYTDTAVIEAKIEIISGGNPLIAEDCQSIIIENGSEKGSQHLNKLLSQLEVSLY